MGITKWSVRRAGRITAAVALISALSAFTGGSATAALDSTVTIPDAAKGTGQRKGTVWVVNRDQGTLMVFDADSGAALLPKALNVGRGAHDICISEESGKVYITAETDNVVSAVDVDAVLDVVTAADVDALLVEKIPVAPLPHHLEPSHDGRLVYVTLFSHTTTPGNPQYAVIDVSDHSVTYTMTSANPAARAHAVFPTRDGDTVYVAHDVGNEVSAIDTASGNIVFSTATSIVPPLSIVRAEEVVATRTGKQLWVAARGDASVKRVDLEFPYASKSIDVFVQPESVMLTPSEHTLVVSSRASPASLAFIDTKGETLLATVPIAGPGTLGDLAVISHDGRYVYATYDNNTTGTGGVTVVDVRTQSVVKTWQYPGTGRPHGVWYSRKARP